MFYKMITNARDRWLASESCTVRGVIDHIVRTGMMRDAQVDAIKTYLFLKIACACRPLASLFISGAFNTLELDGVELKADIRSYLSAHSDAAALFEYSRLKNGPGGQVSAGLEAQLRTAPGEIDCRAFFQKAFYNVSYTDYLFSLPMGAGKTYLMAAFIYLDLYFARLEPQNPAFAHNFIIFAPSGLKASVVPSLRTIQRFDPAWVLSEPAASEIRRLLSFEVLDQPRTANRSNRTKNPNVQKIAGHQPLSELFGLVAVTNAEKVILDRIQEQAGQIDFLDGGDDKDRQANELRNLIGKLPSLSVFIDEVHHAVSDEIKLRAVVSKWAEGSTVNSVIGFSGTPYLEKAERLPVSRTLTVASAEISNIVYYYPLIDGVGNFLKRPTVKIADLPDSLGIVERGVREFLDNYGNTVYHDGCSAKLGIYCGTIEKLEQRIYPLVRSIIGEYGLDDSAILKFHKGNRQYPQPADSQLQFESLDLPLSRIRIVLLVQIGKEGWDCRSLTGIILSQEGDCPKNMVLQTACRCLRQVQKGAPETALIYLNPGNAEKLNEQLQKQQHITLKEFTEAEKRSIIIDRYDRTGRLRLPELDFYQLRVSYAASTLEAANPAEALGRALDGAKIADGTIKTSDFSMEITDTSFAGEERGGVPASFNQWLYAIARSSFGTLTMSGLNGHREQLEAIFSAITYERDGRRCFSSKYDRGRVEANIRKAFCDRRGFKTDEERVPSSARLLNIANFTSTVETADADAFYPSQDTVRSIIADDEGKLKLPADIAKILPVLESSGNAEMAASLRSRYASHPRKDRSFHYLPYKTDSGFEQLFLREVLSFAELDDLGLEVYYNGDRALTEFRIMCYRQSAGKWRYIGMYTPDFLILQRHEGRIYKAIIVETKGSVYANDPKFREKREFMETGFIQMNNAAFGFERFEYLYLEDTLPESERLETVHRRICEFFGKKTSAGEEAPYAG